MLTSFGFGVKLKTQPGSTSQEPLMALNTCIILKPNFLFLLLYWGADSKPDIMNNLENIKSLIKPILKKYGIKKAGIFGSSARGESVVNDLDLLVKIDKKISLLEFIGIQQELEDALGMKVDLVEYDAIKPALKDEILQDEKPVL